MGMGAASFGSSGAFIPGSAIQGGSGTGGTTNWFLNGQQFGGNTGVAFPSYGGGIGLPPGQGSGPYGAVPTVPNPVTSAAGAIGGNLGNLGGISSLTGGLAGANASAAQGAVASGLPGYAGLLGQSSQNIQSDLAGNVSPDVWNQIQQAGAERGVGMGSPDSPNSNAALLAVLGKTSAGLQLQGQQELTGAVNRTPTGPAVNSAEFAVTPDQMQQAGYAQSVFNAAPNPTMARAADQAALLAQIGAGRGAAGGGGFMGLGGGGPRMAGTDALGFPMSGLYGSGASEGSGWTPTLTGSGAGDSPSTFDYNAWAASLPGNNAYATDPSGGGYGGEYDWTNI